MRPAPLGAIPSAPTINAYLAGTLQPGDRLLCPFHDDHRPSAKVLPGPKQRFWCFTCGFSEDRIGVAMRLLFPDRWQERRKPDLARAIEWLELGGSTRPSWPAPGEDTRDEIDPFVFDLMSRFCALANRQLAMRPRLIQELRQTRGIKDPVKLGLGVGHRSLLARLQREFGEHPGWTEANLIQAGLFSAPKGERPAHYRLADRLILPEWRPNPWGRGEVVAFYQARARDDARGKYLNPPIPRQLYGAHTITRQTSFLWVGEGVFDVLPLIEAGAAAIATLGTHLADVGFEQLTKLVDGRTVLLAFDNDQPTEQLPLGAGKTLALRLRERMVNAGIRSELVTIPADYKDLGAWLVARGVREVDATVRLLL